MTAIVNAIIHWHGAMRNVIVAGGGTWMLVRGTMRGGSWLIDRLIPTDEGRTHQEKA